MTDDPIGFVVMNGLVCFILLSVYLTTLTDMSAAGVVAAAGVVSLICGLAVTPAFIINMLLGMATTFLGILWILQVIVS